MERFLQPPESFENWFSEVHAIHYAYKRFKLKQQDLFWFCA